ncbi:MAG TPA: hypothetical protein VMU85_21620 [Stellaceae bacterium]|nr:hypothetical protein [Stellaceae bacterium]
MTDYRSEQLERERQSDADRVWMPMLRPATRTFPAFVERGTGAAHRRPTGKRADVRADHLAIAVVVGILLGLTGACFYGIFYTPADGWAFDRPEAKLAPPQTHRSPYFR